MISLFFFILGAICYHVVREFFSDTFIVKWLKKALSKSGDKDA